jgi:hypothetical protein
MLVLSKIVLVGCKNDCNVLERIHGGQDRGLCG